SKRDWSSDVCSSDQKKKIKNLENQIAELSKQSRLLNQAMAKQCIVSAFYMEQSTCVKIKIDDLKEQIKDYENPEEIQAEIIKTRSEERRVGKEYRTR